MPGKTKKLAQELAQFLAQSKFNAKYSIDLFEKIY